MLQSPLAQSAWTFDAPSFFIGLIVGLLIAGLLYLFRQPLGEGIARLRQSIDDLRDRLTAGAERRYREALQSRLIDLHIGELAASFEAVYVPPRFDPPAPRPSLTPEPVPAQPLTLHQALASAQRLGVLGESGSGRTALLTYLARAFVEDQAGSKLHLNETRLPILVHLAELALDAGYDDPGTPLVEAAITHAPRLVAANLTSLLKSRLAGKDLSILLDGWDELGEADRDAAQSWLSALVQRYPHHRYLVAASPADAGALSAAGFACLSIAPIQPRAIRALAGRWAEAAEGGAPDAAMLAEAMRQPPGLPPRLLDITLAASVWRKQGSMPLTLLAAYDRWIDIALSETGVHEPVAARALLSQLAWTLLNEDRIITAREETIELAGQTPAVSEAGKPDQAATEVASALAEGSALFIPLGQGVAFAHPRIAAYLAATYAHNTGQAMALAARLDDPAWADTILFFAAIGDAAPLVNTLLAQPDDLFRSNLKRLGAWAAIAPPDAPWRSKVMSDLVKVMMTPATPEPLRHEIMRVVISTRDRGLPYLFKQALARPEPHFKRLAVNGFALMRREADTAIVVTAANDPDAAVRHDTLRALGELGGQAAIDALAQALLEMDDDSRRVAAEALANCGRGGWELLQEGASLTDDKGEDVLRVRRAVTYGLARVEQGWARDTLARLEREDKQWFVRSGATEALRLMSEEQGQGEPLDLTPLDMNNLGWLVQWSASKGQPIGLGKSATQALQRALEDLDPNIRLAAIYTYVRLGDKDSIPLLRGRLKDDHPLVREAAYHALQDVARRTREVVPQ